MGEFQKRMSVYHKESWEQYLLKEVEKHPQIPLNQYHHGYVKGFNEAERIMLALIEEAKEEFRIILPVSIVGTKKDIEYLKRVNGLASQLAECILKWFSAENPAKGCGVGKRRSGLKPPGSSPVSHVGEVRSQISSAEENK